MLRYPSTVAGLLALTLAGFGHAATELTENVPAELARWLAGGGTIYEGMPEGFENLPLPESVEAIGSFDDGSSQRVLFRTSDDAGAAARSLAQSFTARGWVLQTGASPTAGQLCHPQQGQMEINSLSGDEGRVYLIRHTTPCGQSPEQVAAAGLTGPAITPEVRRWLPNLTPPENLAEDFEMSNFRRVPGRPDAIEAQADIRIDRSVGEVYGWFMQQMREQGWEPDAEWYGELTAGGNWLRSRDNGQQLVGTLQVIEVSDNQFEMTFEMQQRG